MQPINSFPPIENPQAQLLILGSMPGTASLEANQYYAHPRNAFWPIMEAIFDIERTWPYATRIKALTQTNIALWDVLQQCDRQGSLDSAIKTGSRVANDFESFFIQHNQIQCVAFNGAEAEKSFKRYVLPSLAKPHLQLVRLPSTSPAHTMPLSQKIAAWRTMMTTELKQSNQILDI